MTINVNAIYNQFVNSLLAKLPAGFEFGGYNNVRVDSGEDSSSTGFQASLINAISSANESSLINAISGTEGSSSLADALTSSSGTSLINALTGTDSSSLLNALTGTNGSSILNALGSSQLSNVSGGDLLSFTNALGEGSLNFDSILKLFEQYNASDDTVAQSITDAIVDAAEKYNLDPNLIKAVVRAESNFRPDVVSSGGAMGLMQLMPATARALGVEDALDVSQNIDGGASYLRKMLDRYDGDEELALAAYNAGSNAVAKYGGIPPYSETQAYVPKVLDYKEQYILEQYKAAFNERPN